MEENIILNIEINQKEVESANLAIIKTREDILKLKDANKELAASKKQGTTEFVKNEAAIKALNKTVTENQRVIIASEKAQLSNTGSLRQLREQLKVATSQYDDLTQAQRENEDVGGALQKQIKGLSGSLTTLEKDTGRGGRGVGFYTEGIKDAAEQSGLFGGALSTLKNLQLAYTTASKVATTSTASFGKALIATGIGAVLVLLGGLITFLTSSQEGLDKVSQAFAGVKTFVAVFVDALAGLGKQIFDNIMPALKGLGNIIAGIVTFDFEKMKEGANQIGEALDNIDPINLKKVGIDALLAGESMRQLTKEFQQVERAEADLNVERKKSRVLILQLKQDALDETKTLKEREELLRRAIGLEQQGIDKSIELAEKRLKIVQDQKGLTNSLEEDNQQIRDIEIEIAGLQEESLNKQIELQGQLTGIENKREAERKARQEAIDKETDERIKADLKRLQDFEQADVEFVDRAEQRVLDTAEREVNNLKERYVNGVISKQEYEDELTAIEAGAISIRMLTAELAIEDALNDLTLTENERIAIIQAAEDEIQGIRASSLQAQIKANEIAAAAEKNLSQNVAQSKIDLALAVLNSVIDILGKESAAGKVFASITAGINTYLAITNALASAPPPINFINAAIVGAQGFAQVAQINSSPKPNLPSASGVSKLPSASSTPTASRRFARGGFTGEGYGSSDETGFKQAGIVHENEYVIPKWQVDSPRFSGLIGSLESSRLKGYADGGFVGRSASGTNQGADINRLVAEIKNMPAPVLHISTLQAKTQERNQVRVESRLG